MYKRILVAVDLNEDGGWRTPLIAAAEHAREFGSELSALTVAQEVDPLTYAMVATNLENDLAAKVREVNADDLHPKLIVTYGVTIYDRILHIAQESGVDMIVVGSHRPAIKDYFLGTNAERVVRHATCSVLVARDLP